MVIFYVLFFVVAFFAHMEVNVGIKGITKKKIYLTLFLVFFALSFLRWETGPDWEGYYTHFEIYTWNTLYAHELIYMIILLLAKSIINDYTFVLFCFSCVLFYFQIKGVSKLSVLPLTSLLVLTGTYFCNVLYVRQYIAVAILFYSLVFIIERKIVPFIVSVMLAFGIHYSALVFFPAYWIFNLKFSRKQWIVFILISIFLSSLMLYFLQGIGDLIGVTGIIDRAEKYIDQGYDYEDGSRLDPRQTIIKACINRGLIILIGLYLMGKVKANDPIRGYFNLYCFGTILFFMSCPLHISLTRMSWYYDIVQILIIPAIFLYSPRLQRSVLFVFITFIMLAKLYMSVNAFEDPSGYKFIPSIENLL